MIGLSPQVNLGAVMASPEPTLPVQIPPRLTPLRGPATATSALVAGTCLVAILGALADWHRVAVATDYVAGVPGIWVADLTSAAATSTTVGTLHLLTLVSAGIALLVWLSRARHNGKLLGGALARPRGGWAVALWLLLATAVGLVTFTLRGEVDVTDLRQFVIFSTTGAAVHCLIGGPLVLVVRQVTRAQVTPRPAQADQPA